MNEKLFNFSYSFFDKLEILRDNNNENLIDLKFLYYESLEADTERPLVFLNSTFTNQEIKNKLKIPAHHSMTVLLTVKNIQDTKTSSIVISSILYKYNLVISTKYHVT